MTSMANKKYTHTSTQELHRSVGTSMERMGRGKNEGRERERDRQRRSVGHTVGRDVVHVVKKGCM